MCDLSFLAENEILKYLSLQEFFLDEQWQALNKKDVCVYNIVYVKSEIYSTENLYEKIYMIVVPIVVNKTGNVCLT